MRTPSLLLLIILIFNGLFAMPANPEPGVVICSDNSKMTVYLRGDEYHSWHETEDAVAIIKNKDGVFEYIQVTSDGSIQASGIAAHAANRRTAVENDYISTMPKQIMYPEKMPRLDYTRRTEKMSVPAGTSDYEFEQTTFPTLGDAKFLVIMAEFSDKKFRHNSNDFDHLMNAENYTYNGAKGSVGQYFKATSFDRFNPHFDVVGPVVTDKGYAYYGANNEDGSNNFERAKELLHEVLAKADPLVDYAQYDNNNDGRVDNIYIIYAGYSEANYGADENTIWPHRSWTNNAPTLDGKTFFDYSMSQELLGITGATRTTIAVICHEFSHVLGLWDYYDTDYSGSGGTSRGLGYWDLMSNGGYIDNGNCPPIHNSWSRMFLKWAEPVELLHPENVIINPTATSNEARFFHSPTTGEFFFLENRQKQGYDQALYGHGLLIYHIDKNNSGWNNNSINCDPDRQGFDLEEAKGDYIPPIYYADMDAFPGRLENTSFTDYTSPNSIDWAGNYSNSPITDIQENEGLISFVFKGANVASPQNVEISAEGFHAVDLSWELNSNADSVLIVWSEDEIFAYPQGTIKYTVNENIAGAKVIYKGIDTVFHHLGLDPGVLNHYAIYSFSDSTHIYSARTLRSVSTNSPVFYKAVFAHGLPKGWQSFDRYGHADFSANNPLARTIASTTQDDGFIVIDSENAGSTDSINADLITQSYNLGLSQSIVVQFQHRLEVGTSTLARFSYSTNGGLSWCEVAQWTETTDNPEFFEVNLSNELAGLNDVRFKFSYIAANEKYWCIDDFQINSVVATGTSLGFYATTTSGSKPLTVEFVNTTISNPDSIDSYMWELDNNGDFYVGKNQTLTYTHSGVYGISLMATKNGQTITYNKSDYIMVTNEAPVVLDEDYDTLDVAKNQSQRVNLRQIFSDPNGDPLRFAWTGNSHSLSLALEEDSILLVTPGNDYTGVETIFLIAIDNENDSISHKMDVWVSETGILNGIPESFDCSQNYPNPFNPSTEINYQLPENNVVDLSVFNLCGKRVANLVKGYQEAGFYSLNFNASDLPSGMYLYRLTAGNNIITKKMVLMK